MELTPRLARILEAVIERFVATGQPVGSKYLSTAGGFGLAPSTLRSELACLERLGYLDHPHTSAGRVPTDKGYRFYVDSGARQRQHHLARRTHADLLDGGIEDALSHAAGMLARATGLLALISAPSQNNTAIKHVEVLRLHPDVVMVVIITASGVIAKKLVVFDQPVDRGLIDWARGFLNDAICGMDMGSRRLRMQLEEPELSPDERGFIDVLAPVFDGLTESDGLYLEGVSRFITRLEEDGSSQVGNFMELLDRQEEVLGLLREALNESSIYLRIGRELPRPALQDCSLVAANYGVAHRNLGTVGVLGPTRMDYPAVISRVRHVAWTLSRFVEDIYQ
ncbi:MAG: heat-inducible transcription repressor HrcA [Thermoleophilia bacterium]|nr:heat-inducible transcription repressor HrcA [Thermoleophilia bacterium]